MDKHIRISFVPKHSKLHSSSTVIYTDNTRQRRTTNSHSASRISPWTEPIHSLGIQSSMISLTGPLTTSLFSINGNRRSSKQNLSISKKQSSNKKKPVRNNRLWMKVIGIGLLIFSILTTITYLIIRFTTKSTPVIGDPRLLRWHPSGIMVAGIGGVAGTASNQLNAPVDIAIDSSSTVFITDCFNNRVQKWNADMPNATTIAGQQNAVAGGAAAYFRGPKGILADSNNNIYVSDSTNHRIQYWPSGASAGATIAGTGTSGSDYNALHNPHFITRDLNTNTLYIADFDNDRVMSYASGASNGTLIIGGQGTGLNITQLYSPVGIHFDSITNYLYICNYRGHHIVRWQLGADHWTLVAGTPGVVGRSSTLLSYPNGITLDPMGNLYVADSGNHRIQLFLVGQNVSTTIAGLSGSSGSSSVQLNTPFSVRLDSQLNLYVTDLSNNRIQKFLRY